MKEKFLKGIWVTRPPQGYDIVKTNGVRKIVVNDTGKKLRKAFIWKSEGVKNEDILEKLKALGVATYKQQLNKILKNPFYCGLVCHGLLEGQVIVGTHEKLISQELFLKIHTINQTASGYGVQHNKEFDQLPLKTFVRCSVCNGPFAGYEVKAKKLWYYKCNTKGCCCNRSAKLMNTLFEELLSKFTLQAHLAMPLQHQLEVVYKDISKESEDSVATYKKRLAEVTKKIDALEEKHYVNGEMSKEVFEKFYFRFKAEHSEISKQLNLSNSGLSNLGETIEKAVSLSTKLAPLWASSDPKAREKLQKLVFPDGIIYDREKGSYRTERINSVFELIASLAQVSDEMKKGQTGGKTNLSLSAG